MNLICRMTSENYEVLVRKLVTEAKVLDHTADPCGDNFIPNTAVSNFFSLQRLLEENRKL